MTSPAPKVPAEVIHALDIGLRRWLDIELSLIPKQSPFRDHCTKPQPPTRCYDASFGRVHVRPGCRC